MKKILFTAVIFMLILTGCKKAGPSIIVETRRYMESGGKIEYSKWSSNITDVQYGASVLNNDYYNINAVIKSVGSDNIRIQFSEPVFYPANKQISTLYTLKKNRSYIFELGSGLDGFEIKMRYN